MKFLVDKLPIDQRCCPYHKFVSDIGEIINKSKCICKIDEKNCNFENDPPNIHYVSCCRWLKEI